MRPYEGQRSKHWTRAALDVLRASNSPMTAREIARRIAKDRGITDNVTLSSIECSLHVTLPKREGVVMVGRGPKRWTLIQESKTPACGDAGVAELSRR